MVEAGTGIQNGGHIPITASTNPARPVVSTPTSTWNRTRRVPRRGNRSRHSRCRLLPVAMPSLAAGNRTSLASRPATTTTQTSR